MLSDALQWVPVELCTNKTVRLSVTGSPVFWGVQAALCSAPDILLFLSSHLLIGLSGRQLVRTSRRCMTPVFPPLWLRQKGLCVLQFPCCATARHNLPPLLISIVSYEFINVCTSKKRPILATVSNEVRQCEKKFCFIFCYFRSCFPVCRLLYSSGQPESCKFLILSTLSAKSSCWNTHKNS